MTYDFSGIPGGSTPTPTPGQTPTPTPTPGGSNIAQGKTASADSSQSGNGAANGNDGSTSTRWCANDGNTGHWWKVDLGSSCSITGSQVMWEANNNYTYTVDVSTDNATWTNKVNHTGAGQTNTDNFTATARYVRITATGLPSGCWASFFEFRVYGSGGASNLALSATAAGSPNPTQAAANAKDGSLDTYVTWEGSPAYPMYLTYTWSSAQTLTSTIVKARWGVGQGPTAWAIEVSADGSTSWTQVATDSVTWLYNDGTTESKTTIFTAQTNKKGLRIKITAGNQSWSKIAIPEIEVY
jgi:hypothetical protein